MKMRIKIKSKIKKRGVVEMEMLYGGDSGFVCG